MIPNFKQNKWHNIGDINHRTEGGIFVKRVDDEIEVVQTYNNEEHGGKGYTVTSRTENVSDLIERYKQFKINPNEGVGNGCDWGRYVELEKTDWSIDVIVMYLAADMISWYGGDCEPETGTNYWDLLGMNGISRWEKF